MQPLLQELGHSVCRVSGEHREGSRLGALLRGAAERVPSAARFSGAGGFKLGALALCELCALQTSLTRSKRASLTPNRRRARAQAPAVPKHVPQQ